METQPIFTQHNFQKKNKIIRFLRKYGIDWFVLLLLSACSLGVFYAPPLSKRLFAVEFKGDPLEYDDAYPIMKQIVPTWMSAAIAGGAGVLVLAFAQLWLKSGKEFHRGVLCLVTCLVAASWFQVICKVLIGGLRPNFLAVCQPDLTKAEGQGYYGVYYDYTVCTGDKASVYDALESFPSGHSTAAFAGNIFISLFLNAKLKLWGADYAPVWKLVAVFIPILLGTLLSLCRLVDYTHHWYDILAGAIIGTMFALSAFRMHYCSVFDPATNHLLLPRGKRSKAEHLSSSYHKFPRRQGDSSV